MWEIFSNGLTPYQGMSNAQAREKVDAGSVYYNRPDDLNSMFNNRNLLSILNKKAPSKNKQANKSVYFAILFLIVSKKKNWAIVVVIIWWLDLQLSMQSVPITTKSCEFESCSLRGVLNTILCDKVCEGTRFLHQ